MSTSLHMVNVEWTPLYGLEKRFKEIAESNATEGFRYRRYFQSEEFRL